MTDMNSVEIFSGAGGLALGVSAAGFSHLALVERDRHACATIRANRDKGLNPVVGWPLHEMDVCGFDYGSVGSPVALLAGGPPCQPFSLGGKHKAYNDKRDMFPEAARAVRTLRPKAFVFENVRGLARQSFAKYFSYIVLQLTHPELQSKPDEDWLAHLARLERHHTAGHEKGLAYNVVFRVLNAADYGVPQKRERVFIVGFRADLNIEWNFPRPTHGLDALLRDKWVDGSYWDRHGVSKREQGRIPPKYKERVAVLKRSLSAEPLLSAWRTVRDALAGLPDPESDHCPERFDNHRFNPGARIYPGHTGSAPDEPAKTLKAGDHGVPGGENMIVYPNGRPRYFTVRESARLQTFPDEYTFQGSWGESMRQIGNAVPVKLAEMIATSILRGLQSKGH